MKIDVDGAEIGVLRSGERLLSRRDCRVLLEVHSPRLEEEAIAFLTAKQYRCRIIGHAWWRVAIPERRPVELNRWVFAEPAGAEGLSRAIDPDRARHGSRAGRDQHHSFRSAVIGSTRMARRAGIKLASVAAVIMAAIAAPHATGSNGVIP